MIRFSDIRIRSKMVLLFVLIGVLPLLIVGFFGSKQATDALMEKSFNQLSTVQSIRKAEIENFFTNCFSGIQLLADSDRVERMMGVLKTHQAVLEKENPHLIDIQSSSYYTKVKEYIPPLTEFIEAYGYHDLFLVDAEQGNVLFTLAKEEDLGTNLMRGKFKNSGLGQAWQRAVRSGQTTIVDYGSYAPSGGVQAAFIAEPIRNDKDMITGVLILQLTPEFMTRVVDSRQGMGSTGESYLIGLNAVTNKYEFRSDLRTMGHGAFVIGYSVRKMLDYWQDAVTFGYAGGQNTYVDSAGNHVLVAYNELNIPGLQWYLISKIDKYEVTEPIRQIYYMIGLVAGILLLSIGVIAVLFSRTITEPIITDMLFAQAIAKGELDTEIEISQNDELGDLARALDSMARNLQELDWLKTGKEELDDAMRGEHSPDELAQIFVSYVTKHMGAQLGAIYMREDEELHLTSSYAFMDREGNFNKIQFGEGMIGQAALEKQTIIFTNVKENAPALNYGAGEMLATSYLATPVTFEKNTIGVLLLGSKDEFTPLQRQFIEEVVENVGVLINAATSRQLVHDLLEQAQEQQEELRVTNEELEEQTEALRLSEATLQEQQEELRVTNEELEAQTDTLKSSQAELQRQQEELRVTNEELEERTKALEEQKDAIAYKNAELVKAQRAVKQKAKDLEAASKYKSEFLANMSHELRTPLNSILILSQLMGRNKDGNLTEKQIESASAIHSSGVDLLELINEILDLSKIEAGKVELVIEDIHIENIVTDIKRLFDGVASDKNVEFNIDVASTLPPLLETDSQRLQQVLRNLLTNAFKFTDQGGVSLVIDRPQAELAAEYGINPQNYLSFAVNDDGIGIPYDKQQAIFQAFQQADGSTSRTYGGTGLGLSISKELTGLLRGVIHLASKEGKGSTFTVILPERFTGAEELSIAFANLADDTLQLAAGAESVPLPEAPSALEKVDSFIRPASQVIQEEVKVEPAPVVAASSPAQAGFVEDDRTHITLDSKSLLIIEDDWNFAQVMRDFGRERGFKCLVAEDGETGLHFADYYTPSAIILDIGLPGINGWTVMERLKSNPKLRHIPVHFMSADDNSLDAMRMGAIGFLSKPVTMENIEEAFSMLEKVISKPVSKLLLVEDDAVQRESIKELIGNNDVDIVSVGTGRRAYEELQRGSYDCMVLDLGLEDMSGFELLEEIRRSESAAKVPVIIYTGRDLTIDEEKKLSQYAESIIIKGVKSPERLLDESALFLHRVEADLPEEKQQMLKMVHDKEAVLSNKVVMVVDDDMRNVFALSSILEERNMEVVIAKNGVECLERLQEVEKVDCILMDIMMPKMDGYEAMREVRSMPKYKKLPIIALTAKAMKGDRAKCIEAGASDYLSKPVNTDKLISMMRVWLY